jgi:hypothetical protein
MKAVAILHAEHDGVLTVLTQLERAVSAAERAPALAVAGLAVPGEGRNLRPLAGLRHLTAAGEAVVMDRSVLDGPPSFAHHVLDRLTAMKLHVESLRLHVRHGVLSPEEIETQLAQIEHEIDATAALAHDEQATEARSQ